MLLNNVITKFQEENILIQVVPEGNKIAVTDGNKILSLVTNRKRVSYSK